VSGPLDGQVAVVTGASRGIGRAIAAALAGAGAQVAGCARTPTAGMFACDVSRPDDVAAFADEVTRRFGPPDLLVNNAGTVARARMDELSVGDWDDVLGANLRGTFLVTRTFLPAMRARRRGRIVNIASISGREGTALLTAYCAAKHGVVGLTRALAKEVKPEGIVVNAVCPGSVDTDMLRAGLPGAKPDMSPEDVAGVVLYLATAAPLALTGSCVDVFG
jgi:NAD(P)-dependent dehydrogenase (short-subunit alcohol dehydrogenase family)